MNSAVIEQIWVQGDLLTHIVMLTLLLMSVLTWSVLLLKAVQLFRLARLIRISRLHPRAAFELPYVPEISGANGFNPLRDMSEAGHTWLSHALHCGPGDGVNRVDALARAISLELDEARARLQSGMGILASTGSTAPFVGLLGTVWGIYHTLHTLSTLDQPNLSQIASPMGEALVMTAAGLFVAIPAVLGFNAVTRRQRALLHALNRFAHDLYTLLLSGAHTEPEQPIGASIPVSAQRTRAEERSC